MQCSSVQHAVGRSQAACWPFQIAQSPFAPLAKLTGALKSLPLGAVIWEGPATRAGRGREFYRCLLRRNADFYRKYRNLGGPNMWCFPMLMLRFSIILAQYCPWDISKRGRRKSLSLNYWEYWEAIFGTTKFGGIWQTNRNAVRALQQIQMPFCRQRTKYCKKKAQWHHTKRQQLKTFLLFEVCVSYVCNHMFKIIFIIYHIWKNHDGIHGGYTGETTTSWQVSRRCVKICWESQPETSLHISVQYF